MLNSTKTADIEFEGTADAPHDFTVWHCDTPAPLTPSNVSLFVRLQASLPSWSRQPGSTLHCAEQNVLDNAPNHGVT